MSIPILNGLGEIAGRYDSIICDVWGVVHDGVRPDLETAHALGRFRASRGPVVLLTNAPRLADSVQAQFTRLGVPEGFYDAIMTSGEAARADVKRRSTGGTLPLFFLGPERDSGVFDGLDVRLAGAEEAQAVLCTGLYDDDKDVPEDYRSLLNAVKARNLPFLCANPDLVVQRGDTLIHCAGAIAKLYEEMGGTPVYFGKPHAPVFQAALETLNAITPAGRTLMIGDGPDTDIRGANGMGLDALFIGCGIHAVETKRDPRTMIGVLESGGLQAIAAMPSLRW